MGLPELIKNIGEIPSGVDEKTEEIIEKILVPWQTIARRKKELKAQGLPLVKELIRAPLPTERGDWTYIIFVDLTCGVYHEVLVFGNFKIEDSLPKGILVRIHSACQTNETFGAINCECLAELQKTMEQIQKERRGVIIYLAQEGRGNGVVGKVVQLNEMFEWREGKIVQRRDQETNARIDTDRAYKKAGWPSECRDFSVAGEILKQLGATNIRLVTNNPLKTRAIASQGIEVNPEEIHIPPANGITAADLRAKAINLGHTISEEHYRHTDL